MTDWQRLDLYLALLAEQHPGRGRAHRSTLEKHRPSGDRCLRCGHPWPCPDVEAVAAATRFEW